MKKLSVVVGDYPHMRPLRNGNVTSDLVEFEFVDFKAVGASFDDMLRDQKYDVCEMALVAFMQAAERSTPVRMLPLVALGGYLHESIYYNPAYGNLSPFELSGKRIGVRSYSQTTGVWLRGMLAEQFGLSVGDTTWVATRDAHVDGFRDPPNVHITETGRSVDDLLLLGAIDAAIQHPTHRRAGHFAPLITDPDRAAADWFDRHHVVPVNHVICVSPTVWSDPRLVEEVYSMFVRSYRVAGLVVPDDRFPLSYDRPRLIKAIDIANTLALDQRLIGAPFNVDETVLHS